jgi:hypothetical protein
MKKYIFGLLLSLFLLPAAGFCLTNYTIGDQLYVLAPSGLVLREKASAQGNKITTVALGETVTVLKENFRKVPHSVLEFKGYNIRGFWVKVRTADGQEGYVFDGYLSRYQAPGHLRLKEGQDTLMPVIQYMAAHSDFRGPRVQLAKTPNRYERYKQVFKNKAEVEVNIGEGGSAFKITFNKGTSLEEAYLIGRLLWLQGTVKSKIDRGVITLTNEDETQQVLVMNKAGLIIVTLSIAD